MTTTADHDLLQLVERFFTAYNEMDLDAFRGLLADDV
jgi:ketosteroid isomerase-like protein